MLHYVGTRPLYSLLSLAIAMEGPLEGAFVFRLEVNRPGSHDCS